MLTDLVKIKVVVKTTRAPEENILLIEREYSIPSDKILDLLHDIEDIATITIPEVINKTRQ